ncbi:MAG TPA: LuxR C-terminal-related transcriptional regulator [Acidimicrobiales bacterium]|nr:LuxR C-terminal-related transcriptional regulator [Acidimicrobiales bacterium]
MAATAGGPALLRTWPLVGRQEELAFVAEALVAPRRGVILAGQAGVGKTRLAREAVDGAGGQGRSAVVVAATEAARAVPYGAVSHLLSRDRRHLDGAAVPALLADQLAAAPGRPAPVLVVDDAHLLDEASAAALFHLVTTGAAVAIVTIRSGEPVPGPVAALYKDGLVERLEVQALSRIEVGALLEAVLGGQLDEQALAALWSASNGNVLYLKELVLDALDAGTLAERGGLWRWAGGAGPAARLSEVIGTRLSGLVGPEIAVVELLAAGEALDASTLEELAPGCRLADLERAGVLTSTSDGRRTAVQLAHPLYGEVVRARMGTYQHRRRCQALAQRLEETGCRRAGDLLRLACWRVRSGTAADAGRLARAAEQANRLHETQSAETLARASLQLETSGAASLQLGAALVDQGRFEEAEVVLGSLVPAELDEAARKALAYRRMRALFYGLGRLDDADRALLEIEAATTTDACRLAVRGLRAMMLAHAGRFSEAAELSAALVTSSDDACRMIGLPNVAMARLLGGEIGGCVALVDECLALADRLGDIPVPLRALQVLALAADGRTGEAAAVATALCGLLIDGRRRSGEVALIETVRGHVLLLQGRPRSAMRALRQGAALLREQDAGGFLGWCLSQQVEAAALLGDAPTAGAARDEARSLSGTGVRVFDAAASRARAWYHVAAGDPPAAAAELVDLGQRLAAAGQRWEAMRCLHDAVRLGADGAAAPLSELTSEIDGGLAAAISLYARGVRDRDGAAAEQAGEAFRGAGCPLFSLDAFLHAADLALDAGLVRRAAAARRRALADAERCEGARTPALARLTEPSGLTRREQQVARLAASGLSNRQIATELSTSVRTVEGHLQQAYVKLGVSSRAALEPLFS